MDKKGLAIISLIAVVGMFFALPLIRNVVPGVIIGDDDITISHDQIFSGNSNQISIESNFSIQEISISLNDTVVNQTDFSPSEKTTEISELYNIFGDINGNNGDLLEEDGVGITVISEDKNCYPCHHWEYSKIISVFDSSDLNNADTLSLDTSISILEDEALVKVYYFDVNENEWVKIDQKYLTSAEDSLEISELLPEELKSQDTIITKITAYHPNEDFSLLLDKLTLESIFPVDSDMIIYEIDVSDFEDGEYDLEINILDFSLNPYVYTSEIIVDNTSPVIMGVVLPNGQYNDTDILQYHASIVDENLQNSVLLVNSSITSYSVDFKNSSAISFMDVYLPGTYEYMIISEDKAGQISILYGTFEILEYEEEPEIITYENEIVVYTSSAVSPEVSEAHSYINISGSVRYQYQCNLTYGVQTIDSQIVFTNESCQLVYSTFNETLTLTIYNLNNSNEIVFTKDFATNKIPIINHYDKIQIACPTKASEGYNIILFVECDDIDSDLEYKIIGEDSTILSSGDLANGEEKIIYLEYMGEMEIQIYQHGELIYTNLLRVKEIELAEERDELDATKVSLIIAFASLLIAGIGLLYTIVKDRKKDEEREELMEKLEANSYPKDIAAPPPSYVKDEQISQGELLNKLLFENNEAEVFFIADSVSQLGKATKKGLQKIGKATKQKYQNIKAKMPETKEKIAETKKKFAKSTKKAAKFAYIKTLGAVSLIIGIILGIIIITINLPTIAMLLLAALTGVFITTAVKTLSKKDITFFKSLLYSISAVLVIIIIILILNLLGYNSLSDYLLLTT